MLTDAYARLFNTPLYCTDFYARVVASVLAARLEVQAPMALSDIPATRPAAMPMLTQTGVAIVPIVGGLVHRGGYVDAISGMQSYTNLQNTIVAFLQEDRCKAILLDIDSPGGEVGGCFGLADQLLEARKHKPIWGLANDRACSAAYMLLSSCKKTYATETSHVGSIGVVWQHVDISGMLKQQGIVQTLIYAGAHKVDGNPYEKLSKEVREDFQASVDAAYTMFVDKVAKRRPLDASAVRATEARVYRGEDAKGQKLVDGVLSFDAVLDRLEASLKSPAVPGHNPEQPTDSVVIHDDEDEDAMTKYSQEQLDAAVTAGKAEAHAAGKAEGKTEGYAAGRADAGKVLASDAAKGKPAMAAELAGDAGITVERATALLGKAAPEVPADKPSKLDAAMQGRDPDVGAGGGGEPTENEKAEARLAGLRGTMKSVQGIRT